MQPLDFLNKYNNLKNIRFNSFFKSLSIADSRNLKTFVETGTARGKKKFYFFNKFNWKDGMSTIMFAEYIKYKGGQLYSVDLSEDNINSAIKLTKEFNNYIKFIVSDSVHYLKNVKFKIDFLYLDSLDGHDSKAASLHQLNEIQCAIDKLHDNSIILVDDKSTKGNLSIDFMLKEKFKIINETKEQVLLSR